MPRAPYNVLVLPFRRRAGGHEFAVFHRADGSAWQFIAGGGENDETPEAAARREAFEEAAIAADAPWMALESSASIPRTAFPDADWPKDVLVVPEHCFAVDVGDGTLHLSPEHDRVEWLSPESARERLTWDSNKVASWELSERLAALADEPTAAARTSDRHASGRSPRPAASRPMTVEVREDPMSALPEHAQVSIAFVVTEVLELPVEGQGLHGCTLSARTLENPYTKDYDALENPMDWPSRFDVTTWQLLSARAGGQRVGGAVIAFDTPAVHLLEGRSDLAVLWDLRVAPEARRRGVGAALFRAAEAWARARGCRHLKVETQNINVPACRFYAKQGCVLGAIQRFAYRELPDEVQLLWYAEL